MDLATRYLGFELPHPLMPGASPMVDDLDLVRRLEDAGAAAIVMHSLFEEQIVHQQEASVAFTDVPAQSFAEALSYLPEPVEYNLGPDEYLEQIHRIKAAVDVPLIASLNGTTDGAWLQYGALIEEAGADALEMNVYQVATSLDLPAQALEHRIVDIAGRMKRELSIPIALKLSPFFTALGHLASRLDAAGADALVLFNRFYQADIDIEELEVERSLRLSDSSELLVRLRWLAILSGRVRPDLAVTGGVHAVEDVVKSVMCGAHAVQLVSSLLRHGPERLGELRVELCRWLEEHEYDSLGQMRGSMALARCPDPAAFERADYIGVLQSWRRPTSPFDIG
jgi:dihydroorotate dehydrogenase (fumarate)